MSLYKINFSLFFLYPKLNCKQVTPLIIGIVWVRPSPILRFCSLIESCLREYSSRHGSWKNIDRSENISYFAELFVMSSFKFCALDSGLLLMCFLGSDIGVDCVDAKLWEKK